MADSNINDQTNKDVSNYDLLAYDFDKSRNMLRILKSYKGVQYWFYSNGRLYYVEIYLKSLQDCHKFTSSCMNTLTFDLRQNPKLNNIPSSSSSSSSSNSSNSYSNNQKVNISRPNNSESRGIPCLEGTKIIISGQNEKTQLDTIVSEMMTANESNRSVSTQSVTLGGNKKIMLKGSIVDVKAYFVPEDKTAKIDSNVLYPNLQIGINFAFVEKADNRNTLTSDNDSFNAVVSTTTNNANPVVFCTSDQTQNIASSKHMFYAIESADNVNGFGNQMPTNSSIFCVRHPSTFFLCMMWSFVSFVNQYVAGLTTPPEWYTSIKDKLADFDKKTHAPIFIAPETVLTDNYIGKLIDVISPKKKEVVNERDNIEGGVHFFKFNETNTGYYVPIDFARFVFEKKWKLESTKSNKIVLSDSKININAKITGSSCELLKNLQVYQNGEIKVDIMTEVINISPALFCTVNDITDYLPDNDTIKQGRKIHELKKKKNNN